jgi:hypothetical protein
MELAMRQVENLESNISTKSADQNISVVDEKDGGGYISGDLGVTARMSFRLNSPWKAIRTWIRTLAA